MPFKEMRRLSDDKEGGLLGTPGDYAMKMIYQNDQRHALYNF